MVNKVKINICFLLVFVLSVSVLIFPQQEFHTGVYSNLSPTMEDRQNLKQIYEMGANTVINNVTSSNKDSLEVIFDSIIVFNAYHETDYIHHYTSGYYTKWEAENSTALMANYPGIKHEFGTSSGTSWQSGTNPANNGKLLVTGPDYRQDRQYRQWYHRGDITYNVKFKMKIDGALTLGVPVCELSVGYRTEGGEFDILGEPIIFNADQLTNNYRDYALTYTIPEYINGSPTSIPPEIISGGYQKYSEIPVAETYSGPYGVQFNVKWLGNRNLYVDYIEVYDQYIWASFLDNPSLAASQILNYASAIASTNNTQYRYSLDELHSIDNYEPYKVVKEILLSKIHQLLITTFYPNWNREEATICRTNK